MKNIYKKIHEAWPHCGYVKKDGAMKDGNGRVQYNYVSAENIVDTVREALHKVGLITLVSTELVQELEGYQARSGAQWFRFLVSIKLTIADPESGETVSGNFSGIGQDAGDKAVAKAYTMALKYALRQMLLIETGDADPDKEIPAERPVSFSQGWTQAELVERMSSMPDDIKDAVRTRYKTKGDLRRFFDFHEWDVERIRGAL